MLNINRFGQMVVKGMVDLRSGQQPLSCQIDATSAGGLKPAQAVKIVPSTVKGIPKVVECADDADDIFGFIVYDLKSSEFAVGDRVEVLPFRNGIMYMEASAAVAQNAEVSIVVVGQQVKTAVATDRVVGRALDGAAAAGDLIRVVVDLPGAIKA